MDKHGNLTFWYYESGAHEIDKNFHPLFSDILSLCAHFSSSRSRFVLRLSRSLSFAPLKLPKLFVVHLR